MNKRNVKRLRDFIAKLPPDNFQMDVILTIDKEKETVEEALQHSCGTVGCLFGWSALLASPKGAYVRPIKQDYSFPDVRIDRANTAKRATDWLGLDKLAAERLAMGRWSVTSIDAWHIRSMRGDSLKQLAIEELDHLLKTGEV